MAKFNPYQGDAVALAKYRKHRERWEREGRVGPPPVRPGTHRNPSSRETKDAKEIVADTFRENYRTTREWTSAWNATLDKLAATNDERRVVGDVLKSVVDQILLEEGDPMTVFVNNVLEYLRSEKIFAKLDEADRKALKEQGVDDYESPVLYLEFDRDEPLFVGWEIDYPDYYQGHSGPTVAVLPGADEDSVGHDIAEVFGGYEED